MESTANSSSYVPAYAVSTLYKPTDTTPAPLVISKSKTPSDAVSAAVSVALTNSVIVPALPPIVIRLLAVVISRIEELASGFSLNCIAPEKPVKLITASDESLSVRV